MHIDKGLACGTFAKLIPVGMLEVGAIKSFVATDKFREKKITDGVPIKWIGPTFKEKLLNSPEVDVPEMTLRIHGITDSPTSALLLAELGTSAETALAYFWELLKYRVSNPVPRKEGRPSVNDWAGIAFVRDKINDLLVVRAHWFYGFNIEAYSVKEDANQPRWSDRHQVVSH